MGLHSAYTQLTFAASAQGSLLAGLKDPYVVPGFEPESVACKASKCLTRCTIFPVLESVQLLTAIDPSMFACSKPGVFRLFCGREEVSGNNSGFLVKGCTD